MTNDNDDIWRGSSIASLRRKAVEYQSGSNNNYKWLSCLRVHVCLTYFDFCLQNITAFFLSSDHLDLRRMFVRPR